jgi:hypothetical protein
MTTSAWSDEQISAFLDGELNAVDTEGLARAVETDPALAARLERLGSATRAYVAVVNGIDQHPVSAGVASILAAPPTASVLPFRSKRLRAFVMDHRAIAAGLLAAVAVWGISTNLTGPAPTDLLTPGPDGVIIASSPLHNALEKGQASKVVLVANTAGITPRLTFASTDGAFCRQYDVATAAGTTSAIACREDGRWRNEIAVFGKPTSTSDYQIASGDKSPALEAFIDLHISGAPLSAADESAAIAKGWKK